MFGSLMEVLLAHQHSRQTWDPTQASLGKERRIFQRIAIAMPCRMNNPLFGLDSEASIVNLSMGGMGVIAPVSWPEGSQIKVVFNSLELSGLVVFRRDPASTQEPSRYGIKFQKLGVMDLFKLRKIIHATGDSPRSKLGTVPSRDSHGGKS